MIGISIYPWMMALIFSLLRSKMGIHRCMETHQSKVSTPHQVSYINPKGNIYTNILLQSILSSTHSLMKNMLQNGTQSVMLYHQVPSMITDSHQGLFRGTREHQRNYYCCFIKRHKISPSHSRWWRTIPFGSHGKTSKISLRSLDSYNKVGPHIKLMQRLLETRKNSWINRKTFL
jgi:hypothetical protein